MIYLFIVTVIMFAACLPLYVLHATRNQTRLGCFDVLLFAYQTFDSTSTSAIVIYSTTVHVKSALHIYCNILLFCAVGEG